MTISFSRTRNQIADTVLREMGALANGDTAATADADVVYEAIDMRLKELHKDGIIWRKVPTVPVSFSLSAGTVSASVTADILFPIKMMVVDGDDTPVSIITPESYAAIADKTETGVPVKALWKGGSEFWFWPVPATATTAKLVYERYMDDTSASASVDVDQAMIRSIKNLVRFDVADHWGKPEQTIVRWERQAKEAEKNIRKVNALRVDYTRVKVDDFDDSTENIETDYR